MLSPDKSLLRPADDGKPAAPPDFAADIERVFGMVRRQWRTAAIGFTVGLGLAICLLATAEHRYTAQASILVDRGADVLLDRLSASADREADDAAMLSEVELLRSDTIARKVVSDLELGGDPAFAEPNRPILLAALHALAAIRPWLAGEADAHEASTENDRAAARRLLDNLWVERIGRSRVVDIRYTAADPRQAARIANAIAEAYLADALAAKYDATRRAGTWLEARVAELKQKAGESDLAVQKFKAENGLLTANGRLVSDQQLTELNSALIVAQADVAKAKARQERLQAIIDAGRTDAIVTDVLDSSISNELRRRYLEASKQEADISRRLGANHAQAARLRSDMEELERLMFEELGRIAESYRSEVKVAQSREQSLRDSVATAKGENALAGESQVRLRELERTAETYRSLHQTFLQRLQEAAQQQGFPLAEARIISPATTPDGQSFPPPRLVLALGALMGLLAGGGVGAYRELSDRTLRIGDQVRDELGLAFLGSAPLLANEGCSTTEQHPRSLFHAGTLTTHVADHPLSPFAETLRRAKFAVDLLPAGGGAKVIGVVSALPGEGKSTIAINLAQLLALQGERTLLIDADLRNPGATRAVARHASAGLVEVLTAERSLRDLLFLDPRSRLAFLAAVPGRRAARSSELLASSAMQSLLDTARDHFDYVILDLPPLAPVIDARVVADQLDGFLAVVEWGMTPIRTVKDALFDNEDIARKCLGVVLNKLDPEKMKLYRAYGSTDYYEERFAAYYREAASVEEPASR